MEKSFEKEKLDENNPKWKESVKREIELYGRGNEIRDPFERDYTRILHCQAFRRMKHKTQVFFAPHNDHICTRMEHVLHVASVSGTIAKFLGLNADLTQAIALGHDIGHAPFGHFGEDVLNKLVKQKEGANAPKKFWHERNSLFFADYIETLPDPDGIEQPLNLTYAVRDGLICHCGEIDQQGVRPREKAIDLYSMTRPGFIQPFTWEGCIVKIADKIAFLGRDLEDARAYHIIDSASYRQLREIVAGTLGFEHKGAQHAMRSGKAINTTVLINDMVVDLCNESSPEKGLCFSKEYFNFITEIKRFSFANIYDHWRLQEFQNYAENVINTIWRTLMKAEVFVRNGRVGQALKLYPKLGATFEDWLIKHSNYQFFDSTKHSVIDKKRIMHYNTPQIFDIHDNSSYEKCCVEYISGMTDQFAIQVFEEIITF